MSHGKDIKIISGNSNIPFAESVSRNLGIRLCSTNVTTFSDGEISVSLNETVRGSDVFIIQSTCYPVNEHIMEMLIMCDACRRASASRITLVVPYFGYARQDRKAKSRDPISAKLVANIITSTGADRVLTMDLHAPQIQGFFNIPVDHLIAMPTMAAYYQSHMDPDSKYVVMAPDVGSINRARQFATKLNLPLAIVDKRRPDANESEVVNIIGEVEDRKIIICDDLVDTAGTLCNAAVAISEKGAIGISACATHAVLSGPAIERLQNSPIEELVFLDTIMVPDEKRLDKMVILPCAPVFAEAISRIYSDKPISPLVN